MNEEAEKTKRNWWTYSERRLNIKIFKHVPSRGQASTLTHHEYKELAFLEDGGLLCLEVTIDPTGFDGQRWVY